MLLEDLRNAQSSSGWTEMMIGKNSNRKKGQELKMVNMQVNTKKQMFLFKNFFKRQYAGKRKYS